ncbi:MAG TPA: hypothetical protein VKZ61_03195 [Thermomicrobiales bacterium]|nr:hypothetical protein [Thermomicrobiales bacterium]
MSDALWGDRFDGPVYVLTADQDWAPEWAMDVLFDETTRRGVPLHLFVTNESPLVTAGVAGLSLGIHPNFLPGSTQGNSVDEIIARCRALVPGADTFRCHSFFENTRVLGRLFDAGFRTDSNLGLFGQAGLVPLIHCTGLLRFPVFFEDDIFFNLAPAGLPLEPLLPALMAPGLKVLNFHPILVGLNAPSQPYYNNLRERIRNHPDAGSDRQCAGRGSRVVLRQLIDEVRSRGGEFVPFPDLAREVLGLVEQVRGNSLYEWQRQSWAGA